MHVRVPLSEARPTNTIRVSSGDKLTVSRGARTASGPRSTLNRVSGRSTGRGALHHPYVDTAANSSATPTAAQGRRRCASGANDVGAATESAWNAPSIARRTSCMSLARSRGSFRRHTRSACATCDGTVEGSAVKSGSRWRTIESVSETSSASEARIPVSISKRTQPNAQTSVRLSTSFPRACSGTCRLPSRGSIQPASWLAL
jgi:hypothetical protein